MQRRSFTVGGLISVVLAAFGWQAKAEDEPDYKRRAREDAEAGRKHFPFELVEVRSDQALSKWKDLKSAGRGMPVILGGDDAGLRNLFEPFGPDADKFWPRPPLAEVLASAAQIRWPDDFAAKRKADEVAAEAGLRKDLEKNPDMALPTIFLTDGEGHSHTLSREETLAKLLDTPHEPEIGTWPAQPEGSPGLTVAYDLNGTPLPKVYIALIPTDDWTTIPAYLRWGEWNECPAPEYHVAALRSWRDRYGVELVGMGFDTLNLTVTRPPDTRDAALALAKEQYIYCADIIDQGVETYSNLAAALLSSDWWFFWWD
ncbi:MAG: DUF4253 domain-containing protein [Proteobacteria bacterium]|nr:DUF4253 domain-containing protein [Pseudomonadota bacterium]